MPPPFASFHHDGTLHYWDSAEAFQHSLDMNLLAQVQSFGPVDPITKLSWQQIISTRSNYPSSLNGTDLSVMKFNIVVPQDIGFATFNFAVIRKNKQIIAINWVVCPLKENPGVCGRTSGTVDRLIVYDLAVWESMNPVLAKFQRAQWGEVQVSSWLQASQEKRMLVLPEDHLDMENRKCFCGIVLGLRENHLIARDIPRLRNRIVP